MRNSMIDAPWQTPVRAYLDLKSFHFESSRSSVYVTLPWVLNVITGMSQEIEFVGLQEPRKLFSKKVDYSELVNEVHEYPVKQWNTILREDSAVMFYLGEPSSPEIVSLVDYVRLFPFVGDQGHMLNIAVNRGKGESKANTVSTTRQVPNKLGKFLQRWY